MDIRKKMAFLMKVTSSFYLILSFALQSLIAVEPVASESTKEFKKRMNWWQEARFGMFIHWGPVSLKGTEIGWSRGKQVPIEEYDQLYKQFNPVNFIADEWVALAKATGMKYLVLTAKHHDGFCLWDTEQTDYNIMNTPFGRDVVKELSEACQKAGIRFCTYYSILDWYHPDYNIDFRGGPGYALAEGQEPEMDRYEIYMKKQLKELIVGYGPLGIMWFDGEWEEPWTHERGKKLYKYVRGLQEDIIINNRVDKGRDGMKGVTKTDRIYAGDYDTPEQEVGQYQVDRPWETCMTICQQWAWKPDDKLKSLEECIHILVGSAGGDGNLLLNVGPMPDGRIEQRQADRLLEIGEWLEENGESIYGTRGGPFKPADWGVSTQKEKIIYLHILNVPEKKLSLPPLAEKIVSAKFLNGGAEVKFKQTGESIVLSIPENIKKSVDTIICLKRK